MSQSLGTFYAIREKGTMKFLPENFGRGYTHTEPCAGPQPRLLTSHKAAHLALTAWCKGAATVDKSTDWESGYTEITGLSYSPIEGRSKDKMEIVEVDLVLK
jgi:hypothetical protein